MKTAEKVKPKNSGTKILFENPVLERLSRTHISVPLSMYALMVAGMVWYAFTRTELTSSAIGLIFMGGILVFTFIEYWVHRGVYHMDTDTAWKAKAQYTMHGVHHEYPKDKTRLALPPVPALLIAAILFSTFFLIMGEAAYAFFPGFLVGYSSYLFVHYAVHAFVPPKNFLKKLWINHSIHHYKNGEFVFGVSSQVWDIIFGTMGESKKV